MRRPDLDGSAANLPTKLLQGRVGREASPILFEDIGKK